MKKIWIITLIIILIPVSIILAIIMVEQYNKYALKTATIKFVKEHCNEDITVREVRIDRFHLMQSGVTWIVNTEPRQFSTNGSIFKKEYKTIGSEACSAEPYTYLKLNRLIREFEIVSERKY